MSNDSKTKGLRETYDGARAWLAVLIDNPDKAVSVSQYRAQLKDARRAVAVAHMSLMKGLAA